MIKRPSQKKTCVMMVLKADVMPHMTIEFLQALYRLLSQLKRKFAGNPYDREAFFSKEKAG